MSAGSTKTSSAAVARVATNAKIIVLKDCGHWVLEEKPKETTDALMNFL
jgi:pimeloyl-ACP methyl ester carboxylesterase